MTQNYVTVHVTGTSALDITVARTPQIPVFRRHTEGFVMKQGMRNEKMRNKK